MCPCKDCRNMSRQSFDVVYKHLVIKGIDPTYKIWYHHGEEVCVREEIEDVDMFDVFNMYQSTYEIEEVNNESTFSSIDSELHQKMKNVKTPLYPNCTKFTKISAMVTLYKLKAVSGWSDKSFSDLLELLHDMLPSNNVIPQSLYDVRKFFKTFDLGYQKIHACVNDCCLFRKKNENLETYPNCGSPRWLIVARTKQIRQGVPAKVLRYFPIISRLKCMFNTYEIAKNLTWHSQHKSNDGKMHHPVDSVAWKLIDMK
ncbi:hypothetical protein IC582_005053 [Cucumis melo]